MTRDRCLNLLRDAEQQLRIAVATNQRAWEATLRKRVESLEELLRRKPEPARAA